MNRCNHDCLNCIHSDCISNEMPTEDEIKASEHIDRSINFYEAQDQARLKGNIQIFSYNHSSKGMERMSRYNHSEKCKAKQNEYEQSEKGRIRMQKYNDSEKGKARLQRYYKSEKGRENERRKAERRKLKRLQQKGELKEAWQM